MKNLKDVESQKTNPENGGVNGKELRVYYAGDTAIRKRTTLEKWLIVLCILLFITCAVFIAIAITREQSKYRILHCSFFIIIFISL